jgi:hypothetical protein
MTSDQFYLTLDQFQMTSDQFHMTSDQFEMSDDQNWSPNPLVMTRLVTKATRPETLYTKL